MVSRTPLVLMVVFSVMALGACSADATSPDAGGAIELAVSETCVEGSDPQCIPVRGEHVLLPSAFEQAGVKDATVVEGNGQNLVDLTFTKDGAGIFHTLTEKAAQAGDSARLVVKIGGEVRAAVQVMQALKGDQVQIAFPPDDSAQGVVDLIHGS